MSLTKNLIRDTAIYGLSSIIGRFLNYLLVPLYTHYMPKASGEYGESTNVYAYTALFLVLLTFGMETTLFYFANDKRNKPDTVFSTAFTLITTLSLLFLAVIFVFIGPISQMANYGEHPEYLQMMAVVVALDAMQSLIFSYLRFQRRPIKFLVFKMLFIVFNVGLNLLFFVWLHKSTVFYIFFINLMCTALVTVCFVPDLFRIKWHFDPTLLRRMLAYSWPILLLGIAGILNQVADKILLPLVYPDAQEGKVLLSTYGACTKIAMIMAMITQAFRYAYEPMVFGTGERSDNDEMQAKGMKLFIIFTLLAFLCVMGWLPILQLIIGSDYHEAMWVVPIVMAAEIMMGIYFNLSFWYKLDSQTWWGAIFAGAGCVVLLLGNILFIPKYGYGACAWSGLAGYAVSMTLSYIVGQKKHPIDYPLRSIAYYLLIAIVSWLSMDYMATVLPGWGSLVYNTLVIIFFASIIIRNDVPLSQMPVVGKYFKR